MYWFKIIDSTSKLLDLHAKSIIRISILLLVGVIVYGFSLIVSAPITTASETFLWLYFITVVISFGVIVAVLYFANLSD